MNAPRLVLRTLVACMALVMTLPAGAAAADGEGLLGRVTDFEITMWGFGVIALFMILPAVLTYFQHRLETKKERERERLDRVRKP